MTYNLTDYAIIGSFVSGAIIFIYRYYADHKSKTDLCNQHLTILKNYLEEDIGFCNNIQPRNECTFISHVEFKSSKIILIILERAKFIDASLTKKMIRVQYWSNIVSNSINYIKQNYFLINSNELISKIFHAGLFNSAESFKGSLEDLRKEIETLAI